MKYGQDPRLYNILCKEFIGDGNGKVTGIRAVEITWVKVSCSFKSITSIMKRSIVDDNKNQAILFFLE